MKKTINGGQIKITGWQKAIRGVCYSLFVFLFLLFTTCDITNIRQPENNLPPGMGSVTLNFADRAARTIMPNTTPGLDHFDSFHLEFTQITGGAAVPPFDINYIDLTNGSYEQTLEPGVYSLAVTAYRGALIAARGQSANFTITEGNTTPVTVTLRMSLTDGTGTFLWHVQLMADPVTSATMTITPLAGGTPETIDLNVSLNRDSSRTLNSGLYNIEINIVETGVRAFRWFELLHVYSTLTSSWNPTFTDDHFHMTHYTVTFDYNRTELQTPGTQSVAHGGTISNIPTGQVYGFTLEGWYTEPACLTPWVNPPIYNNITLYAKWVTSATIELDVDQIQNFTPTFEVSDDDFVTSLPQGDFVLSRTGNPNPHTLYFRLHSTLVAGTDYDANSVRWEITGKTPVNATTFTLNVSNPADFTIGSHTLRLTITKDNIAYMVNIPFRVEQ